MAIEQTAAVVLAGGKGKRMKSKLPKVLHRLAGQPMIYYTIETLQKIGLGGIYVVVGYKAKLVKETIAQKYQVNFSPVMRPLGSGHALRKGLEEIPKMVKYILCLNGDDSAFYRASTLIEFVNSHITSGAVASMMVLEMGSDNQMGKVIRDSSGVFMTVLEQADFLASGLTSREVNCGAYVFDAGWLRKNINQIKKHPVKGEYYINQLFDFAKAQGHRVGLFSLANPTEWVGVNTPEQLEQAELMMQQRRESGAI